MLYIFATKERNGSQLKILIFSYCSGPKYQGYKGQGHFGPKAQLSSVRGSSPNKWTELFSESIRVVEGSLTYTSWMISSEAVTVPD